jgi:phosphate uptake regulator
MPMTQGFAIRVDRLKAELIQQTRRVHALLEACFESVFARDPAKAARAMAMDDEVDRADVENREGERAASDRCDAREREDGAGGASLGVDGGQVNNELERVADAGVAMAERVAALRDMPGQIPETFRVMTNSVLGIMRDTGTSYERLDAVLAKGGASE